MKNVVANILLPITSIMFCWSCVEFEPVSEIPEISFVDFSITLYDDDGSIIPYALLEFEFTDGNADFGLLGDFGTHDTTRYNLFLVPFNKVDSTTYVPAEPDGDTLKFPIYYDEKLSRQGQNKIIEGVIRKSITYGIIPQYSLDTFRYEFFIYDQALNKSNLEYTSDLCFKELQ